MKGATHVDVDGSGRINLPSALLAYASTPRMPRR